MEDVILFAAIGIVFVLVFLKNFNESNCTEEELWEMENELDIPYKDRFNKTDEPMFYHPVTGYKGNRANMDAYIVNRERELKNNL